MTGGREDEPELAESGELEVVPEEEPGTPGGVLSSEVAGLLWEGPRSRNVTRRPKGYVRGTQGSPE
jgi:hypothetical protein